ncbi:magnesium transporter NIPA-domain-containing protein [Calycina marina]|uniref:Magnesium transporter NIPA-domain-containing protein n=1 Tax=Calycina marina TaxID=1763456 RepID=A0A9P8CF79_9HELO|nr:magnesium transporter NIPA-domain-containing protein [Calycina marina]
MDQSTAIVSGWNGAFNVSLSYIYSTYGDGESQLQRWSSLIGIVTAIIGNILISFALNIQRYAHIRLHKEHVMRREKSRSSLKQSQSSYGTVDTDGSQEHGRCSASEDQDLLADSFASGDSQLSDDERDTTYLSSSYWWGGIVLMSVGEIGNFLAYGFAPASIVSPLGVVALISNCIIAPIFLKERFRQRDFWGVVVSVAGAVTVVLSAKTEEKKLGPHEIIHAVTRTEFEVYMGITIALIGVLLWASPKYGNKTILVDLGLVGLFGGYTALSTKGISSMLSSTLWRAFTTPITYVLLAILVGTAIMQVKYVNKALQQYNSTQVIPVQFVMFTLSVIIGSAILFRDFETATAASMTKFVGGCLLTFVGVSLITSGREQLDSQEESDQEGNEEQERFGLLEHPGNRQDHRASKFSESLGQVDGNYGTSGEVTPSRRSSRVSFSEPIRPPRTPKMYSSSSIRVNTSAPLAPDLLSEVDEPPLLSNPWNNSSDDLNRALKHPGIRSATSSPIIPSGSSTSVSTSSKPPNNRSATHDTLHTPQNLQRTPQPPQADRSYTTAMHSISRMMPGPLLSPLSGGLSVVIADSLRRRGIESPVRTRSARRPRTAMRASERTINTSSEELLSPPPGETRSDPPLSQSLQNEGTNWSRVTRSRSLSNTLGDLFRMKRQGTNNNADEEAGSSEP